MAAPKTTDLSTVDQLSTLNELRNKLQNIIVELESIRPVLELYTIIAKNADLETDRGIKLVQIFSVENELLADVISGVFSSLKNSISSVCDLNECIEERIFKVEGKEHVN